MDSNIIEEIVQFYNSGMKKRAIARKLGIDVKTVRKVLHLHVEASSGNAVSSVAREQSKLAPYLDLISYKVGQGLTGERILREIREEGYTGGRTIMTDHIQKLRGPSHRIRKSFRRFETAPAAEIQCDWSPYQVSIGGKNRKVHCFSMVLCYSRYMFIQFHRDERLPSLLSAHVDAFRFFEGVSRQIVYDNMTTVTLGRRRKEVIWNAGFLDFCKHYMVEPVVCRPYHPNRKGKVERPFYYLQNDFLLGRSFSSWSDLEEKAMRWLQEIANKRVHSTTRQMPHEMWLSERDFLTTLPETPFPVYRQELRTVYDDGTISLDGTKYSLPALQAAPGSHVSVHVYPSHIDILDRYGTIIATHKKPDNPGGLILDPQHYKGIGHKDYQQLPAFDRDFLCIFPNAADFLDGLKSKMGKFYSHHIMEIFEMNRIYGNKAVSEAICKAETYANFNIFALRRILKISHPRIMEKPELPIQKPARPNIDDLELGEFQDYRRFSLDEYDDYNFRKENS